MYYFSWDGLKKSKNGDPGCNVNEHFIIDPNAAIVSNIVQQENIPSIQMTDPQPQVSEPELDEPPHVEEPHVEEPHVEEVTRPTVNKTIIKRRINNNYFVRQPTRVVRTYNPWQTRIVKVVKPENFSTLIFMCLFIIVIVLLIRRN